MSRGQSGKYRHVIWACLIGVLLQTSSFQSRIIQHLTSAQHRCWPPAELMKVIQCPKTVVVSHFGKRSCRRQRSRSPYRFGSALSSVGNGPCASDLTSWYLEAPLTKCASASRNTYSRGSAASRADTREIDV
jgi:hypothetical protein